MLLQHKLHEIKCRPGWVELDADGDLGETHANDVMGVWGRVAAAV